MPELSAAMWPSVSVFHNIPRGGTLHPVRLHQYQAESHVTNVKVLTLAYEVTTLPHRLVVIFWTVRMKWYCLEVKNKIKHIVIRSSEKI